MHHSHYIGRTESGTWFGLIGADGCLLFGLPWEEPLHIPLSLFGLAFGLFVQYLLCVYLPMRVPVTLWMILATAKDIKSGLRATQTRNARILWTAFWCLPLLSEGWYLVLLHQDLQRRWADRNR